MKYLVPSNPTWNRPAHIWLGFDTACRMHSTGGLTLRKYTVADAAGERRICAMCAAVSDKDAHPIAKSDARMVTWGDEWPDA